MSRRETYPYNHRGGFHGCLAYAALARGYGMKNTAREWIAAARRLRLIFMPMQKSGRA